MRNGQPQGKKFQTKMNAKRIAIITEILHSYQVVLEPSVRQNEPR